MSRSELILVTGGAGFIGSHLVDALAAEGCRVRVLDNLDPQVHGPLGEQGRWPAYAHPGAEYCRGDVRDRQALAAALEGVETVYHLAAATGVGQSMYRIADYFDANVQGTAVLLDLLANTRNSVRRLVLASSRAVYGEGLYACPHCGEVCPPLRTPAQLDRGEWEIACPDCRAPLAPLPTPERKPAAPGSMYAITKLAQEQMCLAFGAAYGLPAVALRFFNVYGPRQSLRNPYTGILTAFLNRLVAGESPEVYEDGRMSRDFVHVDDVVRACRLARDAAGQGVFNVGSGRATGILEAAGLLAGLVAPHVDPCLTGKARVGDIRHCTAGLARSTGALGYAPQVGLEAGLRTVVAAAQAAGRGDGARQAEGELRRMGLLRG